MIPEDTLSSDTRSVLFYITTHLFVSNTVYTFQSITIILTLNKLTNSNKAITLTANHIQVKPQLANTSLRAISKA